MSKFYSLILILILFNPSRCFADIDNKTDLCKRDCKMEYNLFRTYAKQGSSIANFSMAMMNYKGHGRDVNIPLANRQLLQAARAEEPIAMFQVGYFLMYGIYMEQDIEQALKWMIKANRVKVLDANERVKFLKYIITVESKKEDLIIHFNELYQGKKVEDKLSIQSLDPNVEYITIVSDFVWSYVLDIAEQQTCNTSRCILPNLFTVIPRIRVENDQNLFSKIQSN